MTAAFFLLKKLQQRALDVQQRVRDEQAAQKDCQQKRLNYKEESSDEEETQLQLAIGLSLEDECALASKRRARKASKTLEDQHKSMTTPKKGQQTRRQSLALVEKSAKDFIQNRNVSVPFSKIRRPAFHRP